MSTPGAPVLATKFRGPDRAMESRVKPFSVKPPAPSPQKSFDF